MLCIVIFHNLVFIGKSAVTLFNYRFLWRVARRDILSFIFRYIPPAFKYHMSAAGMITSGIATINATRKCHSIANRLDGCFDRLVFADDVPFVIKAQCLYFHHITQPYTRLPHQYLFSRRLVSGYT